MQADLGNAISRLEQVTERLLRLEATLGQQGVQPAANSLAASNTGLAATQNGPVMAAAAGGSVADYDRLLAGKLQLFMAHAAALGGEVLTASKLVEQAFQEQRAVLLVASKAKEPNTPQLQSVLQPVAAHMMSAAGLADNRRSAAFQQLKVLAEGLQALSWLAYTGPSCGMALPAQHIAESWNAAEFFANKILKESRGVNETQVDWVKAVKDLFTGLQDFVRSSYPTGLKWNPSGCNIAEAQAAAKAGGPAAAQAAVAAPVPAPAKAPVAAARGPPVPPPPPPPGLLLQERPGSSSKAAATSGTAGGAAAGGLQDVLKALKQGTAVTSGLRKVTDDMKSKSRTERSGHITSAPAAAAAPPTARQPAAAGAAKTGPPKLQLEQERKWVVENQIGQQQLVVTTTDSKHSVYIFNCSNSVVHVKGKCNAISVDKCKKVGVLFEDVIALCELVNCSSIQVQCTGAAPTVSIDKCDGVQAYIPAALAANPNFQVVTAKSSEVNLLVVAEDSEAEDVAEHAVPEQFISVFRNGKLVTTAASHGGG